MRANLLSAIRLAGLAFVLGALTSAIGTVIGLCWNYRIDPATALDRIGAQVALYSIMFAASGLGWILLTLVIWRAAPPQGPVGWVVRIAAATILMGPLTMLFAIVLRGVLLGMPLPDATAMTNPATWFGYLGTAPFNMIALVRGTILVGLALSPGLGSAPAEVLPPDATRGTGRDHVTRLLCGSALLDATFRRAVLDFFKDKWTATAPEFGLDTDLLVRVSTAAEIREKTYYRIYIAVAAASLLVILLVPGIGLTLGLFAAAFIWFRKTRQEQALARIFSQGGFSKTTAASRFNVPLSARIAAALPTTDHNLVIYRGFTPFVGAGYDLGGWSFVTFVDRPRIEGARATVRPFTIPELYKALDGCMDSLRLPSLQCRDYFFVRGIDIKGDPTVLSDPASRPRQSIPANLGAFYAEEQDARIRQYKCFQFFDWGGEVVISFFLRCALQGNTLLVEMKRYVLPPVADAQRTVDRLRPDGLVRYIRDALAALIMGPLMTITAPVLLLALARDWLDHTARAERKLARRRREETWDNPAFDYGATTTLRLTYAQNRYLHYFQKSDADFSNKLIERKLLDQIERFLEEHGIDTTDIRDRQMTILNSGILVQGGDVRAEALAVGQGAQARKTDGMHPGRSKEAAD